MPSTPKKKEKARDDIRTDEGDRLVREIMDEFMTSLGKGIIDTNVFGGPVS